LANENEALHGKTKSWCEEMLIPQVDDQTGQQQVFQVIAVFPQVQVDAVLGHGKEYVLSGEEAELMLSRVHQNDFDNPGRES